MTMMSEDEVTDRADIIASSKDKTITMMSEDEITDRADIIASSKDMTIIVSHKK